MVIDDHAVTASGSLLVAPGERATLNLPFGVFELAFRSTGATPRIDVQLAPRRILFDNADDPPGHAEIITIPRQNGGAVRLRLWVRAIHSERGRFRLIHYTTS
ncbi:hypothetical protein [Sphingomonas morindae]|uniref:Uncharacterized protein n=1 Tax=Sphingomonas morindae TaxID=1541170 RepID=A0ABY4X8B3_9SPHN|nr:hypothetical protein [Sphingomonas morindae]USI73171.1 hypothetical protein LHA26_01420 [Sphingomonas morindae]